MARFEQSTFGLWPTAPPRRQAAPLRRCTRRYLLAQGSAELRGAASSRAARASAWFMPVLLRRSTAMDLT